MKLYFIIINTSFEEFENLKCFENNAHTQHFFKHMKVKYSTLEQHPMIKN